MVRDEDPASTETLGGATAPPRPPIFCVSETTLRFRHYAPHHHSSDATWVCLRAPGSLLGSVPLRAPATLGGHGARVASRPTPAAPRGRLPLLGPLGRRSDPTSSETDLQSHLGPLAGTRPTASSFPGRPPSSLADRVPGSLSSSTRDPLPLTPAFLSFGSGPRKTFNDDTRRSASVRDDARGSCRGPQVEARRERRSVPRDSPPEFLAGPATRGSRRVSLGPPGVETGAAEQNDLHSPRPPLPRPRPNRGR